MAYNPSTTRHSILPSSHPSLQSSQSNALQARINGKRAELANLRQLRDLSGQMATQMQALETKLATLRDGTEAVACILGNWDNVLKAISMASTRAADLGREGDKQTEGELPVTLVRIPVKQGEDGGG